MGKIYDGIMGLVVGDALGVPVEFRKRDSYSVKEMMGHGTYNQPIGTWSDDSSLTLATVASMGRTGKIDPTDIMNNFFLWLDDGAYTPYGKVFDVGGSTRKAISRYANGTEPLKCGGKSLMDNGNGALMRILPVAMIPDNTYKQPDIIKVAHLTHAHYISDSACLLYTSIVEGLMNENSKESAFEGMIIKYRSNIENDYMFSEYKRIPNIYNLKRNEVRSSGYVVDTLEAALWCFLTTSTYKDCVLTAVNLGEDTDTVAAVAGGLAGIVYGCGGKNGIPTRWINQIARKEWIQMLCDNFESKFSKHSC